MGLSAVLPLDHLIDRISDGAFLRDLAQETGLDKRRLSERLRKHPDYQAAKECAIEVQLDDAQLALRLAREPADIARAREMFRAAAWRAEREFPSRWGQKVESKQDLSISVRVNVLGAEGRLIEGQSVAIPAQIGAAQQQVITQSNQGADSADSSIISEE